MNKILFFLFVFTNIALSSSEQINTIIDKYVRYDKWSQASIALKEYIASKPDDPDGYALLGMVYSELSSYDEAVLYFKKSLIYTSNDEKKGEYYYNIANILYKQNNLDTSIDMLNKSIDLNPVISGAYYLKGLIYYEKGEIENTIVTWNKYLKYSSDTFKNDKIVAVLSLLTKKIEDDKKAKEDEERRKQELLDMLKSQLDTKSDSTKSLQDYKINKDKNDNEEFELID